MALDPFLSAQQYAPADLVDCARRARERGFIVMRPAVGLPLTLVAKKTTVPAEPLTGGSRFAPMEDATYALLETLGVIAVAGHGDGGTLSLTGGSVSSCHLLLTKSPLVVRKQVGDSRLPAIDSLERHRAEARWIASLGRHGAGRLFPRTEIVHDSITSLAIDSEFVAAYTLGEWFLQRNGATAAGTSDDAVVSELFRLLANELYTRQAPAAQAQETYHTKLRRRLVLTFDDAAIGQWVRALYRDGGLVNGVDCRSIEDQMLQIERDPRLTAVVRAPESFRCHGDLIPEDILVDCKGSVVALVDPNPQNADPLVDIGKFVMSCCVCYDLALRDWLSISASRACRGGRCVIDTGWPGHWERFARRQYDLGMWVAESAPAFLPRDVWSGRSDPSGLLLLAGLHAACIAPFHLIHHHRPMRALYFIASGQALIERALRGYGL